MPSETEPIQYRTSGHYISIPFDPRVMAAIDKFRFKFEIPTRNDAIRRMIEFALKHPQEAAKGNGAAR